MNQLDVYYRALLEYKALTQKDRDASRLSKAIAEANTDSDKIIVTRRLCQIDDEWVTEIEKGLVFIEKAIREERQFIYSNGEVVPIEKVKNVSKESVVHLAKHSELITRIHDSEDIVPDKIYTVERLNDYTVYENRFLYMLLCYLRDFVTLRYNKILDATNKYEGKLNMDKEIVLGKQTLKYKVSLEEIKKDDKFLREHNEAKAIIDRMDLILKTILALLATPLMEYQSKAPMLRPPITKTNVLRMDNDFKGAVALYDYIVSYEKPGYTITDDIKEIGPFPDDLSEEIAEAGAMMSFLTYEYGLGVKPELKKEYLAEEERRKVQAIQKQFEKLESVKRKLLRSELSAEEYIVEVEKQVRMLKKMNDTIEPLQRELDELKDTKEKLTLQIAELNAEIKSLNDRIFEMGQEHIKEIDELHKSYSERITDIMQRHQSEMSDMRNTYAKEIDSLRLRLRNIEDEYNDQISALKSAINELNDEIAQLTYSYNALEEQKVLCDARIHAYMYKNGEFTKDQSFTDRESFKTLEREYEMFNKFFGNEWKKTKKQIRKELLSFSNLRKKSDVEDANEKISEVANENVSDSVIESNNNEPEYENWDNQNNQNNQD